MLMRRTIHVRRSRESPEIRRSGKVARARDRSLRPSSRKRNPAIMLASVEAHSVLGHRIPKTTVLAAGRVVACAFAVASVCACGGESSDVHAVRVMEDAGSRRDGGVNAIDASGAHRSGDAALEADYAGMTRRDAASDAPS